jgi:hypothetical protein
MHAARELIRLIEVGEVTTYVELEDGDLVTAPFKVKHLHGAWSMCAGSDEIYFPCRMRAGPEKATRTSASGRKGFDYPKAVVRILAHLDANGSGETADRVTHIVRLQYEREGAGVPSYSRLQPFVSELIRHRRRTTHSFPD